jgi:hypothetical protein
MLRIKSTPQNRHSPPLQSTRSTVAEATAHHLENGHAVDPRNAPKSAFYRVYDRVLERKFSSDSSLTLLKDFLRVVGTVVTLYEPISVNSLSRLLSAPSNDYITTTLSELHSLVAVTEDEHLVQPQHPSFIDYLTCANNCPPRFYVAADKHHAMLAGQCFITMANSLKKTPTAEGQRWRGDLKYALCYWSDHLMKSASQNAPDLLKSLRSLIESHFASWLMGLFHTKRCHQVLPSIGQASDWLVRFLFQIA